MPPSKPAPAPKKRYDKTSTQRSQALIARIKATGGAVVQLRADGELIRQIDDLVEGGEGVYRPDVLANLVRARHKRKCAKA